MKLLYEDKLLCTAEFSLAVALLTFGFTIECLDRTNGQRVEFCFKREPGIERITENFWRGTLMVNAVSFYQNLKILKARLHNEK